MNKLTQYSIRGFLSLTSIPVIGAMAQALPGPITPIPGTDEEALTRSIIAIIQLVINILLGIAGALAAAYLIYAGIQYIQGGKGTEAARTAIINAITGIIIILLAYVIVNTVISSFGPGGSGGRF